MKQFEEAKMTLIMFPAEDIIVTSVETKEDFVTNGAYGDDLEFVDK